MKTATARGTLGPLVGLLFVAWTLTIPTLASADARLHIRAVHVQASAAGDAALTVRFQAVLDDAGSAVDSASFRIDVACRHARWHSGWLGARGSSEEWRTLTCIVRLAGADTLLDEAKVTIVTPEGRTVGRARWRREVAIPWASAPLPAIGPVNVSANGPASVTTGAGAIGLDPSTLPLVVPTAGGAVQVTSMGMPGSATSWGRLQLAYRDDFAPPPSGAIQGIAPPPPPAPRGTAAAPKTPVAPHGAKLPAGTLRPSTGAADSGPESH